MSDPTKAVFLSYASQDARAVSRLRDALEAVGVEVWFDQEELKGGDAWDAAIRRRIKECALFVPVISATTNARDEGYFRLEWKLAVDRSNLIAADKVFLLPVTIDGAQQSNARVPERFLEVQWSSVADQDGLDTFALRVQRILGGVEMATRPPLPPRDSESRAGTRRPAAKLDRIEKLPPPNRGLGLLVLGVSFVILGAVAGILLSSRIFPDLAYRVHPQDFGDARRVATALLDPQSEGVAAARRLLSIGGRERIAALLSAEPSDGSDWRLRRALAGEFNQIIAGDVRLDGAQGTEASECAASNRKALEATFSEQLSVLLKPRGVGEIMEYGFQVAIGEFRHGPARVKVLAGLLVLTLVYVPWLWARQRPASIRFTFQDVHGIDDLLEFLVMELGWKRPARKGKALYFRPTLQTFLVWNVFRLTAWVEGNSVTVTGPDIFVRRLTEAIAAHAQGSQAAGISTPASGQT